MTVLGSRAEGVGGEKSAVRRLHPLMRAWLVTYAVTVLVFGLPLYLLSESTDRYFAWTILEPLTAAYLGACYLPAFATAILCARAEAWARGRSLAGAGLLASIVLVVPTFVYLDQFHMDEVTGWVWLVAYVGVGPSLAAALLVQVRAPGGDPPRRYRLPQFARALLAAQGCLLLLTGAAIFLFPSDASSIWPWALPPLAAQAIGSWLSAQGVFVLQAYVENDWMRVRPAMAYLALFGALAIVALLRYPDTPQWGAPEAYIFVAVAAGLLAVGLFGLWAGARSPADDS